MISVKLIVSSIALSNIHYIVMGELSGKELRESAPQFVAPTEDPSNCPKPCAAVVIQHFNGMAHLIVVIFHPRLSPENYMQRIREEYQHALGNIKRSSWNKLFTESVIGTAQVDQVRDTR